MSFNVLVDDDDDDGVALMAILTCCLKTIFRNVWIMDEDN